MTSDVSSENAVTDVHSEPIFSSHTVRSQDSEEKALDNSDEDKVSKSDPLNFGEAENYFDVLDSFAKEVDASNVKEPPTDESAVEGECQVDNQEIVSSSDQVELEAENQPNAVTTTTPFISTELTTPSVSSEPRDVHSSTELPGNPCSVEKGINPGVQGLGSDIYEYSSDLNTAGNERSELHANSSPVPGFVPPHNTPVVGNE